MKVPATVLLMVSVQVSVQLPSPLSVGPASGVIVPGVPGAPPGKVTTGVAKLGVPVLPGKAVSVMVNVSALWTGLTGVCGLMLIVASTYFLTAEALSLPSVLV